MSQCIIFPSAYIAHPKTDAPTTITERFLLTCPTIVTTKKTAK